MMRAKSRMKALPNWLIFTLTGLENCIRIDAADSEVAAYR